MYHERDVETGLDYRGARFYDSDVARFLSLDPAAMEYPNHSDYCYVVANPVMYIDPDGKNAITTVEEEKDDEGNVTGGTITISSTVHISGKYATQDVVDAANKMFKSIYKDGTYIEEGKTWNVKFNVKYVLTEAADMAEFAKIGLKKGDNVLVYSDNVFVAHVWGNVGKAGSNINHGYLKKGSDAKTILHETGHLLGLSDRYQEGVIGFCPTFSFICLYFL